MTQELRSFVFGKGSHRTREEGMCLMEVAAMLAGEAHTDKPECVCPVINRLGIWVNDSCSDELRQELLDGLPYRLVGTKSTQEIEHQRAFMAADWAVRFVAPILLEQAGLQDQADSLRNCSAVIDRGTAAPAYAAAREASNAALSPINAAYAADCEAARAAAHAADAATNAAYAATYAAYAADCAAAYAVAHAASVAAYAAACEAAYAADCAVDYAAACEAAYAAACAASNDLETIQRSCVELIDRMIRLTEPQEIVPVCLEMSRK